MNYELLRSKIALERPDIDLAEFDRAYQYAKDAHGDQTRYSGEPYIIHPVGATEILLQLSPDLATIQACLMHDVTEDTDRTIEDVEKAFGPDVARLVQGCEKLSVVKIAKEDVEHEKWRSMFLAMASDIRIVFIKLADRLHNMRTLEHVPPHKQARIARETLEVHAAIAARLGMYEIKSELQDLCFKHLYPDDFATLSEHVSELKDKSEECMAFAMSQLEQLLMREGVNFVEVEGRFKHLWSIHEKMGSKGAVDLNKIFDLFAVRIILPDDVREGSEQVGHLYSTLGLLHQNFLPLQDRFKDYVAVPKPNGYRSLHTTVLGMGGDLYTEPTEIQLRTMNMHREAEIGVASHSEYKLGKTLQSGVDPKRHMALYESLEKIQSLVERKPELEGMVRKWVENYQYLKSEDRQATVNMLITEGISEEDVQNVQKARSSHLVVLQPSIERQLAWLRGLADQSEAALEMDLFPDQIFVLTPKRAVIQLSRGATPVDFAYAIHTEVGNKMTHAKVNGRIVPLDYELRNGEMVEVITRNDAHPSRYWLSLAKTSGARTKIKNWFHREDFEANVTAGRDLVNRQLQLLGHPQLDEKLSLLKEYAGKSRSADEREQILEAVGLGSTTANHVVRTLFPQIEERKESVKEEKGFTAEQLSEHVLITGEEDLPVVLSACCKPRPPHAIIGYVTRGRSIRVHHQSCRELGGLEGERFVSAHWKER